MPPSAGEGAAATKAAMAATAKRATLENILKGLLVVVVRIGKFFCWEMTKLDIRLKKYGGKRPAFIDFWMVSFSQFLILLFFEPETLKDAKTVKDARSQPQRSPRRWARTSDSCHCHSLISIRLEVRLKIEKWHCMRILRQTSQF